MTSECVLWRGAMGKGGYGQRRFRGVKTSAHRAAWIEAHGTLDPALEIDHLCGVRACINLDHLEAVTHSENQRRAAARRTHCRHGHPRIASGPCKPCTKLYQQSAAFKASVRRWEQSHLPQRRAYQREWMRRKRAASAA